MEVTTPGVSCIGFTAPPGAAKMSTRAIRYLKQKEILFEVVTYAHEEKGAEYAARAVGFPVERTIKTLVVDLGQKKYAFVLMPGDRQLNLKQLAGACSVKKAAMVDAETARRLTGYQVGGISPFGSRQPLPVAMEESLLAFDRVLINAGQRGTMVMMSPGDIVKALDCKVSGFAIKRRKK
ncbi:MAG: aminoacyl-tRNA deacylase [Pseudomonadota bacterium]